MFIVLFLVSFLFDTRIGLVFLAAAILLLYRGRSDKRVTLTGVATEKSQPAWKDPWGTGQP